MVSRKLRIPANAAFAGGLLMLSASCVPGGAALEPPARLGDSLAAIDAAALPATPPPAPQPLLLQEVAPDTAAELNAAIPVAAGYNPPARSFTVAPAAFSARMRSIECLTAAIYYEAASESDDGQRAVAQVVLNRVRHPTYPNSVCGVVYQGSERSTGCQFSFTCDGSLARVPSIAGWARARRIAAAALAGSVYAPVGYSTHYHT
ncbi:MAG TPA: cell wall hydrolase, partial [Allosphingosinicella sp.]|nr:cell wall hydrolase [Allosphingosinicella sp.]